jgi:DNA polymerase-3 subunit beta
MSAVSKSCSTDESRYVLISVLIEVDDSGIKMTSTDARRFCQMQIEHQPHYVKAGKKWFLILPESTVRNILKMPVTADSTMTIKSDSSFARIDGGRFSIVTRLIEAHYPNYKQVIPEEQSNGIFVPVEKFKSMVAFAECATDYKSNSIKLTFSKNNLDISASSKEKGTAKTSTPILYSGKEKSIIFQPHYLIDACDACYQDEQIRIEITDSLSPIKIIGTGTIIVIMPMKA